MTNKKPTKMEMEIAGMLMHGASTTETAKTLRQTKDKVEGISWEIHQDEQYWTGRVKSLRAAISQ